MRITCIDFETANSARSSICSVGIALIVDGEIVETHERLIKPHARCSYFDPFNIEIHGITSRDVRNSPEFQDLVPWLWSFLQADLVIAHNAAFDMSALRAVSDLYAIPYPAFDYFCTYKAATQVWPELYNHKLDTVSAHIGHRFKHHNAEADAEAAGKVLLAMLQEGLHESPKTLSTRINMRLGRIFPGGYKPCSIAKAKKVATNSGNNSS